MVRSCFIRDLGEVAQNNLPNEWTPEEATHGQRIQASLIGNNHASQLVPGPSYRKLICGPLIFIHGLEAGHTKNLRKAWEQAFRKTGDLPSTQATRTCIFGFRADELLCNGRQGLVSLSQYLGEKIRAATTRRRELDLKIIQGKLKGRNSKTQLSLPGNSPRKIILLAHGIANLLVQETLANFKFTTSELALRLKGVIFLDPPTFESNDDWVRYQTNFLQKLSMTVQCKDWLDFRLVRTTTENFKLLLGNKDIVIAGRILEQSEEGQKIRRRNLTFNKPRRASTQSTLSFVSDVEIDGLHLPSVSDGVLAKLDSALQDILNDKPDQWLSYSMNPQPGGNTSLTLGDSVDEADKGAENYHKTTSDNSSTAARVKDSNNQSVSHFRAHLKSRSVSKSPSKPKAQSSTTRGQSNASTRRTKFRADSIESILRSDMAISGGTMGTDARDFTNAATDASDSEIDKLQNHLRFATLYHQSGEFQQARREYERVELIMSEKESNGSGLTKLDQWRLLRIENELGLAVLSLHQGCFKEAERHFTHLENEATKTFPELDPKRLEISQWLGIALCKMGKYPKANEKLDDVLKKVDRAISQPALDSSAVFFLKTCQIVTRNALALVISYLGDFEGAISEASRALQSVQAAQREEPLIVDATDRSLKEREGLIHFNRASIHVMSGNYDCARSAIDLASKIMEQHLGTRHAATLECRALNVRCLLAQGDYKLSEILCRKALKTMQNELGDSHPLTLGTNGLLVATFTSFARLTEARNTARHLVRMNEKVLGKEHPQSIDSQNQLAAVHLARGEVIDAFELQKHVLNNARAILGPTHHVTLSYGTALASMYLALGETKLCHRVATAIFRSHCQNGRTSPEKEELGVRSVFADPIRRERLLSDNHISTLANVHLLGVLEYHREGGDFELASNLLRFTFTARTGRLSAHHPDTLSTQLQVGIVDRMKGDLMSAIKNIEPVAAARQRSFGNDHPEYLNALQELNLTRFFLSWGAGNMQTAVTHIQEQRKTLHLQVKLLDWRHPDYIRSSLSLSTSYATLGKPDEAIKFQTRAIAAQLHVIEPSRFWTGPEEVFQTIDSLTEVGTLSRATLLFLDPNGFSEDELFLSKENIKYKETRKLPQWTRTSVEQLISLCARHGSCQDALDLQLALAIQDLYEHGTENVVTLGALNMRAILYQELGRFDKAESLYKRVESSMMEVPTPYMKSLLHSTLSNLASLYFRTEKFEEALQLQQRVHKEMQHETAQENRKMFIRNQFNLALTLKKLDKQSDEALRHLQVAASNAEKELAPDDSERAQICSTLKEWLGEGTTLKDPKAVDREKITARK
ncbi:MAG: hypothetical protein Q9160_004052 [Pyrenula sp. 1 TL-2023]